MRNLETLKEVLKKNDYLVFVVPINPQRWSLFKVYYYDPETKILQKLILEESPFWSKRYYAYHNTAIGTDRVYDIITSISYQLFGNPDKLKYQLLY